MGDVFFQLKLDGREGAGLFTQAEGGGSENVVIEQRVALPNGAIDIRKIPGNLKFHDITLKRGIDVDRTLWDWRQQIVDGKFSEARSDGTIQLLDASFAPLATFRFRNGWVSRYTFSSGGTDQAAVEELTIAIEDFRRQ